MTDQSLQIAATLDAIFAKFPSVPLPAIEDPRFPVDLWKLLEDSGFTWFGTEDGVSLEDNLTIAMATGRAAAAVPLIESASIASWLLAAAGVGRPSGLTTTTAGLDQLTVSEIGDGRLEISGTMHRVPWGRFADHVATVVPVQGEWRAVVLPVLRAHVRPGQNLAREPRDDLDFNAVMLGDDQIGRTRAPGLTEVCARGALLRAAAAAGAMQTVLDKTVTYSAQRHQFGKPISSFQAVQHHLVGIASGAASTTAAVRTATVVSPDQQLFAAACAKVVAAAESRSVARHAHQTFGAIGTTDEHDLHLYTGRLWSWEAEFGSAKHWARSIGSVAFKPAATALWPLISGTAGAFTHRAPTETVPW